jgi:hypothetical protein
VIRKHDKYYPTKHTHQEEKELPINNEFYTKFFLIWIVKNSKSWEVIICPRESQETFIPEIIFNKVFNKNPCIIQEREFSTYYNAYLYCLVELKILKKKLIKEINDS